MNPIVRSAGPVVASVAIAVIGLAIPSISRADDDWSRAPGGWVPPGYAGEARRTPHRRRAPETRTTRETDTTSVRSVRTEPRGAREPFPLRVELLGEAQMPIHVGAVGRLVLVDRVFIGGSLGVTAFSGLFTSITRAAGTETLAQIVDSVASGGLAVSIGAGFRPIPGSGFELAGGYTMLTGAGALTGAQLADALGQDAGVAARIPDLEMDVTLHAVHLELAWTFIVGDHFLVRPAIGWTQVATANVSLVQTSGTRSDEADAALAETAGNIAEVIPDYGMTPTLSLAAGVRF